MVTELEELIGKAPRVILGSVAERVTRTNDLYDYGLDDVRGVSNSKEIVPTKANVTERDLERFYVVCPGEFVFNRRVHGTGARRLGLGFNCTTRNFIFTEDYVVFSVDRDKLLPEFLFIFFRREDFNRYVITNSWGSATEFFNWEDMCRVKIPLPPIEVQRAYVKAYQGLTTLIEQNEALVKELEKTAQACIVECRQKWPMVEISALISEINVRNVDGALSEIDARGVNTDKQIQKAKRLGENLTTYKVVHNNNLVFNPNIKISNLGEKFAVAINKEKDCIVSNFYTVVQTSEELIPEYLYLWLIREEFARYMRFISCSSVRESFGFDDMCRVKIPLPPIEVQRAIVSLYTCAEEARKIAAEAKELLKKACPAMVQSAAHHKTGVI